MSTQPETSARPAQRQVRFETLGAQLEQLEQQGNWSSVWFRCREPLEDVPESHRALVEQTCTPHVRRAFEAWTEQLTAARDAADANLSTRVNERIYEDVAKALGQNELASAELLLAELDGARLTRAIQRDVDAASSERLMGSDKSVQRISTNISDLERAISLTK